MYSKYTPKCSGKWLPFSGVVGPLEVTQGVCIVGVYRLRSVQCGQLLWNVSEGGALEATQSVPVLWAYTDYDLSSVASCYGMYLREVP
jgi:hypothetical protein